MKAGNKLNNNSKTLQLIFNVQPILNVKIVQPVLNDLGIAFKDILSNHTC